MTHMAAALCSESFSINGGKILDRAPQGLVSYNFVHASLPRDFLKTDAVICQTTNGGCRAQNLS